MMRRSALTLVLLLAGCSSGGQPPSPNPSSLDPVPVSVSVERTGGIAGVKALISVDPSGKWTRQDQATGPQRSGRLSIDQTRQLQRLAADPRLAAEAATPPAPSKCADSFQFKVIAGSHTVTYTDCPSDSFHPAAATEIADFLDSSTT